MVADFNDCGNRAPDCRGGGRIAYHETAGQRVRERLAGRGDVIEKKMMRGLSFMVDDATCCAISGK
jgi:hypothetical protein